MNKYHQILDKIVSEGNLQENKKGKIKYLLNEKVELQAIDLLEILEGQQIARNKLKAELDLFTLGVDRVKEYNEVGVQWWDYCGEYLVNSYPKYFEHYLN